MPYAYSTYLVEFTTSKEELRQINQHLSQQYGTRGWSLVSVTPTSDQSMLIYAFQVGYNAQQTVTPLMGGPAAPMVEPVPLDPLGQPALLADVDAALDSAGPKATTESKKKVKKKKAKKKAP